MMFSGSRTTNSEFAPSKTSGGCLRRKASMRCCSARTLGRRKCAMRKRRSAKRPRRWPPMLRQRRAEITQEDVEDVRTALDEEAKRRPVRIDFFDEVNGPFYKPEWVGLQLVVWINRKHPFYAMCYGELLNLTGGYKAKQALDVLLLTLAKAELQIDEETAAQQFRYQ